MLITLSRPAAISQSVAEAKLIGVVPLGAVSHRFIFKLMYYMHDSTSAFINSTQTAKLLTI